MNERTIEKHPRINIFKPHRIVYYFKHFFDDPELFRELEPYYEGTWRKSSRR